MLDYDGCRLEHGKYQIRWDILRISWNRLKIWIKCHGAIWNFMIEFRAWEKWNRCQMAILCDLLNHMRGNIYQRRNHAFERTRYSEYERGSFTKYIYIIHEQQTCRNYDLLNLINRFLCCNRSFSGQWFRNTRHGTQHARTAAATSKYCGLIKWSLLPRDGESLLDFNIEFECIIQKIMICTSTKPASPLLFIPSVWMPLLYV